MSRLQSATAIRRSILSQLEPVPAQSWASRRWLSQSAKPRAPLATLSPRWRTLAARQPRSSQIRHESTDARPIHKNLTDRNHEQPARATQDQSDADTIALRKALSPAYQLWITCKKCLERSAHTISKQAYHFGSCVVQCPKCKSQHLISDNLKIFSDTNVTMEDIAKEHGQKLRKGKLGVDGDIEFYDDEATAKIVKGEKKSS